MHIVVSPVRFWGWLCLLFIAGYSHSAAKAALSAEKTLLLIDSEDSDSLYLGNVYADLREIPESNIICLSLQVDSWDEFLDGPARIIRGELVNRGIQEQIDAIVVAPIRHSYRLSFENRVPHHGCDSGEECTIQYISLTSALAMIPLSGQIVAGDPDINFGFTTHSPNPYFSDSGEAIAFSRHSGWLNGNPVPCEEGQQLYLVSMLGFLGEYGNSRHELMEMVENSSVSDYMHPCGAFYYMETPDYVRTCPRLPYFDDSIWNIEWLGGNAIHGVGYLPGDDQSVLGVMTGAMSVPLEDEHFSFLPGSFADNLTSFAGVFGNHGHTRVSDWIRAGATLSYGTVDEPYMTTGCDGGKFPHPQLFHYVFQGLTLGESLYRSLEYLPFLGLVYGDLLSQPFSTPPVVVVPDWPEDSLRGIVDVTPQVFSPIPGVEIASVEVYIDGVFSRSLLPGDRYSLDPYSMGDGSHEIRFVAVDDSQVKARGRFTGMVACEVFGRSLVVNVDDRDGDSTTVFEAEIQADDEDFRCVQLIHHGRVIASTWDPNGIVMFSGNLVGEGPSEIQAVAVYCDSSQVQSAPVELDVDIEDEIWPGGNETTEGGFQGWGEAAMDMKSCVNSITARNGGDDKLSGSIEQNSARLPERHVNDQENPCLLNQAPVAYDFEIKVSGASARSVHFPIFEPEGESVTIEILSVPAQATLSGDGMNRMLVPNYNASGIDLFEYKVSDPESNFDVGRAFIRYQETGSSFIYLTVDFLGVTTETIAYSFDDYGIERKVQGTDVIPVPASVQQLHLRALENGETGEFIRWVVNDEIYMIGEKQISVPVLSDITAIPAYRSFRKLSVVSNKADQYVQIDQEDLYGEEDGIAPLERFYTPEQGMAILMATHSGGRPFSHWRFDGVNQPRNRQWLIVPSMNCSHTATVIYKNCPGDSDHDDDMDLIDIASFQVCVGDSPTNNCLMTFDLASPFGVIDSEDWDCLSSQGMPTGLLP